MRVEDRWEDDDFDGMRVVLQFQEAHRVTLLRRNPLRRGDEAADAHELALLFLAV